LISGSTGFFPEENSNKQRSEKITHVLSFLFQSGEKKNSESKKALGAYRFSVPRSPSSDVLQPSIIKIKKIPRRKQRRERESSEHKNLEQQETENFQERNSKGANQLLQRQPPIAKKKKSGKKKKKKKQQDRSMIVMMVMVRTARQQQTTTTRTLRVSSNKPYCVLCGAHSHEISFVIMMGLAFLTHKLRP
jgi:hypothetical protein